MTDHQRRVSTRLLPAIFGVTILVVTWLTLFGKACPVHSQEPLAAPGADILFLVDQSGSMGGKDAGSTTHEGANDPSGWRFEAPQSLVELLAEDHLSTKAVHRVALIDFGDRAVKRLDWTTIAPANWEELRSQIDALNADDGGLGAGPYKTSNLGNTNFQAAFTETEKLFAALPPAGDGRVRAIIVLTDGQPCVPPPPTPTPTPAPEPQPTSAPAGGYAQPCLSPSKHMTDLQTQVRRRFPAPQYKIFVVALDKRNEYWPSVEERWKAITGDQAGNRARKITDHRDIGIFLHDIWFKELSKDLPKPAGGGTEIVAPVGPGPVVVPPYLDNISFTLFKKVPEETLEVRDATNRLLTPDPPDVTLTGKNILKLTVLRPQPGLWRVSTTGSAEDVDIEMHAVVAQGYLLSPKGTQVQYVPTTIEWQLLDSSGQPLPEYADPRYRLAPAVKVWADSEVTPVKLQYKGESSYAATFTPVRAGLHTIEMVAIAHDLENKPITVFSGTVAGFTVGAVTLEPVNLPVSHPEFVPLALTYELRDQAGQPVGVKAGVTVSATVQGPTRSWPLPLQATADGRFQGEFVPVEPGQHRIRMTATLVDATGQVRSLADGPAGSFNAAPLTFAAKSPIGTQAQHLPMTISYQVLDGSGNELRLAPGYQFVFTATMSLGGQVSPVLDLQPTDPTTYVATFTPDQQGNYNLLASAGVQGPDGRLYPAFTHRAQVAVIPTTRIGLELVHPGPKERQYVRRLALRPAGFFSAPNPLVVEVQFVDERKQTVDPRSVLRSGMAAPLQLTVVDADNKKDFTDRFELAATGVPGVYRAEGSGLPAGRYTVSVAVAPGVQTQPAYVLTDAGKSVQNTAQLVENPYWIALWAVIALAIAGTAVGLLLKRQRDFQLSRHPARGTLQVENEHGQALASRTVSGRNYLVLTGFSAMTHIRRLEVKCLNDNDSRNGVVSFMAVLDDGARVPGRLTPTSGRAPLGSKYKVYLRKIN